VTIAYLNKYHKGENVFLLGTKALEDSFIQGGINLSDDAKIVVVGFDMTLTYEKLEKACTLIRNGAKFYSTHPDINCPTKDGFIPDSGAICAAIELSTGVKPRYFGKPNAETVEMLEEKSGLSRDNICMVGDRLYTDIALGKKHGVTSVLVLSGETQPEDVDAASIPEKPDFVFPSLDEVDKVMFG
jgi:HAD superfamily hydrolase (TIGR01450 family)